jgi:hypothetical protein
MSVLTHVKKILGSNSRSKLEASTIYEGFLHGNHLSLVRDYTKNKALIVAHDESLNPISKFKGLSPSSPKIRSILFNSLNEADSYLDNIRSNSNSPFTVANQIIKDMGI